MPVILFMNIHLVQTTYLATLFEFTEPIRCIDFLIFPAKYIIFHCMAWLTTLGKSNS